MGVKYLTDQGPDGASMGYDANSLISFYGYTPIIQRANAYQATVLTTAISAVTTTGALSSSAFGFSTAAQADAIITAVNSIITRQELIRVLAVELRNAMVALGLVKGSA